jgi:hypothetical protein
MAEPLLELCPHCGAHFRPREAILQRIARLEAELKDANVSRKTSTGSSKPSKG